MRFIAINQFQMQIAPSFVGKSLKKLPRQSEPERGGHVLRSLGLGEFFVGLIIQPAPDEERPPTEINYATCETFIHRHVSFAREWILRMKPKSVAADSFLVTQRLHKRQIGRAHV